MGEMDLKHKVLAIVEEEGASRATYALKLLQSEGSLSIASTGKDPVTGKLVTHQYRVEGPVMMFLTTTAIDIEEDQGHSSLAARAADPRRPAEAAAAQAAHPPASECSAVAEAAVRGESVCR
jgi:hypothetical protein